ncbi:MAG: cardiolipin synthase [Kofleriaceae bacterium]
MSFAEWSLVIGGFFAVWAFIVAVMLVLQRRSPASTIAWLLLLAFLPIVGWFVYRLIGPQRLARRKQQRRSTRKLVEEAVGTMQEIECESPMRHREQLARIAIAAGEAPPLRADALELYADGASTYRAIADAIDAAKHHVHIEYYIWANDQIGARVREHLVKAAKAGVQVRVIVDGTGGFGVRGKFFKPLTEAGGEVVWFNPIRLFQVRRRRPDFRSHRKIVVCDGRIGFTGGMNIADSHSDEFSGPKAWRDTHVRIEGSAVRALQRVFIEDWVFAAEKTIPATEPYFPIPTTIGGEVVQIVSSGPDLEVFAIHKMFFAAINQAVKRIWLTTPYFVPDDAIQTALVSAAMRGVDVRLIVPAKGDSKLVDLAARSYFSELLEVGALIYEYGPRFIHAKTFVIDDDVSVVGTANLDNRSFRLDFEVAAFVYGDDFAAKLATVFERDLVDCHQLTNNRVAREKFWTRLGQAGARLLSPLL